VKDHKRLRSWKLPYRIQDHELTPCHWAALLKCTMQHNLIISNYVTSLRHRTRVAEQIISALTHLPCIVIESRITYRLYCLIFFVVLLSHCEWVWDCISKWTKTVSYPILSSSLNVADQWLAFLFCIWEDLGSNFSPENSYAESYAILISHYKLISGITP